MEKNSLAFSKYHEMKLFHALKNIKMEPYKKNTNSQLVHIINTYMFNLKYFIGEFQLLQLVEYLKIVI